MANTLESFAAALDLAPVDLGVRARGAVHGRAVPRQELDRIIRDLIENDPADHAFTAVSVSIGTNAAIGSVCHAAADDYLARFVWVNLAGSLRDFIPGSSGVSSPTPPGGVQPGVGGLVYRQESGNLTAISATKQLAWAVDANSAWSSWSSANLALRPFGGDGSFVCVLNPTGNVVKYASWANAVSNTSPAIVLTVPGLTAGHVTGTLRWWVAHQPTVAGLYRSTDYGNSWTTIAKPSWMLTTGAGPVITWHRGAYVAMSTAVSGYRTELYRSQDLVSWKKISSVPQSAMVAAPTKILSTGSVLVVANTNESAISVDLQRWEKMDSGGDVFVAGRHLLFNKGTTGFSSTRLT